MPLEQFAQAYFQLEINNEDLGDFIKDNYQKYHSVSLLNE
jgi:hypothetical protein